jgi:hypothetical protein
MTDFTQMHIFFAVTTAAVVLLTAFACGALVALLRFLRTLDRIANEVEEEATLMRADLDELREGVKKGFRLVPWLNFFGKVGKRLPRKSAPRKNTRT